MIEPGRLIDPDSPARRPLCKSLKLRYGIEDAEVNRLADEFLRQQRLVGSTNQAQYGERDPERRAFLRRSLVQAARRRGEADARYRAQVARRDRFEEVYQSMGCDALIGPLDAIQD